MMISPQKDFFHTEGEDLETVCFQCMKYYNFLLTLPNNTEDDNKFYQIKFDECKFYDC